MFSADVRSAAYGHGWTVDRFAARPNITRGDLTIWIWKGRARVLKNDRLYRILTARELADFLRTEPADSEKEAS